MRWRASVVIIGVATSALLGSTATTVADVDAVVGREILSRPTDRSVTVRLIAAQALDAWITWGSASGRPDRESPPIHVESGPVDIRLDGLTPATKYSYQVHVRRDAEPEVIETGPEHRFRTRPNPGTPFTFVVQSDPHLDDNSTPAVYQQALRNALDDDPDFLVDLGDTAMTDKCTIDGDRLCQPQRPTSFEQVVARNRLQRSFFEQVGHSVPIFLVLGNHEGEAGWFDDGTASSLAAWSTLARKGFYANPEPDDFYGGNAFEDPIVGRRQNYYAFEWGEALFVALDPFTYTTTKPAGNDAQWRWTLGEAQYGWLKDTLRSSRARFKFVFSHHLVGGRDAEARGGAAFAGGFEWGGRNADGTWGFDSQRPGWEKPIHDLFVETGVSIWFHGHDHLYVMETRDGVVYQEVPQPSQRRSGARDLTGEYGYLGAAGVNAFPNSGHLRVRVGPTEAQVEYVRTVLAEDETPDLRNRMVSHRYTVRR